MKYALKLFISKYMEVGGEYKSVEASKTFTFKMWDDVQNVIGYLAEGSDGSVKFEIDTINEEA